MKNKEQSEQVDFYEVFHKVMKSNYEIFFIFQHVTIDLV